MKNARRQNSKKIQEQQQSNKGDDRKNGTADFSNTYGNNRTDFIHA